MDLYLCSECGHLQILHVVNPEILYRNYVYTTSLSLGLRDHFDRLAADVVERWNLTAKCFVVELGSNDGTVLRFFKERGIRVLGIDPAVEIARRATEAGIETIADFFNERLGIEIRARHGAADVILANNIIANVDDLDEIASGVRNLMAPEGVFVFETQYGLDVTERNLLDTVYHEHLSYFNVKPLSLFFRRHMMEVVDVVGLPTKGGSIRVTVKHVGASIRTSDRVARCLENENKLGSGTAVYYAAFLRKIERIREQLHELIDSCRKAGKTVAGYGISVGTTTLIAQFGLEQKIDFLVDDDPEKGKVLSGPGYDIPILPPQALYAHQAAIAIVFAWRYVDPIAAKHPDYLKNGAKFVVPLPQFKIRG